MIDPVASLLAGADRRRRVRAARAVLVLACLVSSLASTSLAKYAPPKSARVKFNFNSGWRISVGDATGAEAIGFDDSAWKQVTTPYAWNEDDAFRKSIQDLSTGVAWYRKHFKIPAGDEGKKIFLEFEGIRQAGEFYLNGKFIGRHENGVMAFGFDITDGVKPAPQENLLAVRIDNSWDYRERVTNTKYQWSDRNFYANYGGINKNVFLHVTDKLHQTLPLYSTLGTTGVYVYAQDFDIRSRIAQVTAESQIKNEYAEPKTLSYEVVIEDASGKAVKTISGGNYTLAPGETKTVSASAKVGGLNFWSWGYGYLYDVDTILKVNGKPVDVVRTRTGFRKTEFGHGMVKLNDRTIQFKGYAQRTTNEWPALGSAVPAWVSDFSNRMIVEDNGNLVRWMHVTPWKQDVESFDRLGLIESMPAGDSEKDAQGRQWEQRLELMRDAIIYNRNNPSILFYESGNKGVSEEHMRQMRALKEQFDPHGGRASGSREMLESRVAEYGGEMLYVNKSARTPFWAMEYSRDEGLRKYWDEYSPPFHKDGDGPPYRDAPAREYNRNQDSQAIEDATRWFDYWRERPGTGERVSSGGVNIIFSDSNTHYRGAENYRRSGEVDAMRLPKDGYFAHQVMWDGWVDVERPRSYIIGHWNYAAGTRKNVYVVSSAEKVELLLNGKSLSYGEQSSRFLYTFKNVEWQPGTLRAVGYDAAGKRITETEKKTAGQPAAVRLTVHTAPQGLTANGSDVVLVDVEVVDAAGQRCPTALNMINFSLAGPAEWRGGIAQGPDNYILAKTLPVENGVNRVIIRSRTQAGKIVVNASSEGLKPASVEIVSHAVSVADGLSLEMPDRNLPSYLDRSATPAGESFKVSRTPVHIISASAGSNGEQTLKSYDDDETTGWSSAGGLSAAWIKYNFAKPSSVGEVTLKLGGGRERRYPVRITVDGQEVFNGTTPPSLGYVTLALKRVTGKSIKIELTGQPTDRAITNITELNTQKKPVEPGFSGSVTDGTLNIVEIEIYQ
jgi:beta-galactosidase